MLLADVTLNPNKTQKTGLKRAKSAEKQNARITENENVNFKSGLATALKLSENIAQLDFPTHVKRSSVQVMTRPLLDDLATFLEEHEDVFAGLIFAKIDGQYVSQKIRTDIATGVAQDYADKVHTALKTAAQEATPTMDGIKSFLTKVLKLRTQTFPFDVKHSNGQIQLVTPPKNGTLFETPNKQQDFLDGINPDLNVFLLEHGLGAAEKITLANKKYRLSLKTEKITLDPKGNPFNAFAESIKGIEYQEIN